MEIVRTNNLCKKYKDKVVVNNVNMHINEGDVYGFVGENGAGKTTIIRLLTGLAAPTAGSYFLFGKENTDPNIGESRKLMGGIVENVSLSRSMTAMENLRTQCILTNSNKTDEDLIKIIELVGLNYEEIKNKKVKNFSLGMRQRIGIGMAMVSSPKFILLDEPLNGLDPKGFVDVRETIERLAHTGVTFLISSHILSELEKVCNKIGFISHGKLIEEITMDELHKKSRPRLVVTFNDESDKNKYVSLCEKIENEEVVVEDNSVTIIGEVDPNEIIKIISSNNIKIESINVLKDTIESYYIQTIRKAEEDELKTGHSANEVKGA